MESHDLPGAWAADELNRNDMFWETNKGPRTKDPKENMAELSNPFKKCFPLLLRIQRPELGSGGACL